MAPPLTADMAQALRDRRPLLLLAEIEHPNGTARFWSGIGPLEWNGVVWTGAGVLGNVTPIKHTTDIGIQEIQFSISGVDPAIIETLGDDIRNLAGCAWLACLDDRCAVIRDPFQVVDSRLDYQSFKAGDDGTVTITITARSGFYTLDRGIDQAWSAEQQKLKYPNDSGFDLIAELQNKSVQWTPN